MDSKPFRPISDQELAQVSAGSASEGARSCGELNYHECMQDSRCFWTSKWGTCDEPLVFPPHFHRPED